MNGYDDRFTDGYIVGSSNGNNNGFLGGGWEGIIGLIVVAGLFGGGFGNGGLFGNRGGSPATQADLSAGFANSEIMSDLNDIILGQAQMQNFINQGFAGLNSTINTGFAGVNNAICTLGYQNQAGFNQIGNLIQSCCCDLKTINLENRYLNEKQTCDIVAAINAGNQRLVDIYTNDKIETLNRKLSTAEAQLSNNAQSRYIVDTVIDKLSPCPSPAYIVPNPNCCYNYGVYANNGCGASVL
jgi:hypothetical protein